MVIKHLYCRWKKGFRYFTSLFWLLLPYVWLSCFLIIPLFLIVSISFSELRIGSPPYSSLVTWIDDSFLQIRLSMRNYFLIFSESLYVKAYLNSLGIAFYSTAACLLVGYPIAYGITKLKKSWQMICLILAVLPFGTSFLVRVYTWINILSAQGLINHCLMYLNIIQIPLELMNNKTAVILGITYSYLPFMIFPLYSALEKIDFSLIEAAYDLGCKPFQAFWRVIFPLSLRGVLTGASLVFIPAVGEYVIPELLGGATSLTVGRILWYEFFTNRDWPVACALAVITIFILLIPIFLFEKFQKNDDAS